MLIIHNFIRPLILPQNDFQNGRNRQLLINSLPNLRKPSGKKGQQQIPKRLAGEPRNSIEKKGSIFDNEFKKKYYSVCSQMLKIKQDWKNEINLKDEENTTSSQGFKQVRMSLKRQQKIFTRPRIISKQIKFGYSKQNVKDKNKLKIDQKNNQLQIDKLDFPFRKSHIQTTNQLQKEIIYLRPKAKHIFQPLLKNNLKKSIHLGKENSDLKGWINNQDTQVHDFTYLF